MSPVDIVVEGGVQPGVLSAELCVTEDVNKRGHPGCRGAIRHRGWASAGHTGDPCLG